MLSFTGLRWISPTYQINKEKFLSDNNKIWGTTGLYSRPFVLLSVALVMAVSVFPNNNVCL